MQVDKGVPLQPRPARHHLLDCGHSGCGCSIHNTAPRHRASSRLQCLRPLPPSGQRSGGTAPRRPAWHTPHPAQSRPPSIWLDWAGQGMAPEIGRRTVRLRRRRLSLAGFRPQDGSTLSVPAAAGPPRPMAADEETGGRRAPLCTHSRASLFLSGAPRRMLAHSLRRRPPL